MKKFNTKHAIKNNFVSTEEREGVLINRVKLSKQRHKKLDKGKGKKVGFIESIVLKITGYCDGRKGLPRQTDDNAWYSPFMSRDVNSYEEFCSHIWGSLQIENEVAYARLEELMDKILQERGLINTAKSKLEIAYNFEKELELSRKKGEDKLTDAQIYARRKAEKDWIRRILGCGTRKNVCKYPGRTDGFYFCPAYSPAWNFRRNMSYFMLCVFTFSDIENRVECMFIV